MDEKMTFEYWMAQERAYAKMEYEQVARRRYDEADQCHKMRWRCMDAAVKCIEGEQDGGLAKS